MKEHIYLHIPQPCHEDWDKMTPVDKGKFCGSCAKQVVDFTNMSDQQVLNYLKNVSGKTCGRFAEDQLQRALQPVIPQKKKAWWIAAMMPLLLLFEKSNAQKRNDTNCNTTISIKERRPEIMGKVAMPEDILPVVKIDTPVNKYPVKIILGGAMSYKTPEAEKFILIGKITDQKNNAVPFASVSIKGTNNVVASNAGGYFNLNVNDKHASVIVVVSSVGYLSQEVFVNLSLNTSNIIQKDIVLKETSMGLGEVIVVGYTIKHQKVKKIDTVKAIVQKIFKAEPFKIYPNPIQRGNTLKIDVKNEGNYSIQLFDNSSKLLLVKDFIAVKGAVITSVDIPSSYAAGMYYLRVVDEKKKKQYTDKIIIQ